jgi:mannose-6-phosphate isomerase
MSNKSRNGAHATITKLSHLLIHRWVPKWYEAFTDNDFGGVHERVGHSFKPIYIGQRRLLTHCRQLALYSHAALSPVSSTFQPDLTKLFKHILASYKSNEKGGWYFSVDDNGQVLDKTYDLYSLGFVIFALSHYYRVTKDQEAEELALSTLQFIQNHFSDPDMIGFYEQLNEDLTPKKEIRRHESHMHLLEACLFAYETWRHHLFLDQSHELITIFRENFYDKKLNLLSEYYSHDLSPLAEDGVIITEPGHYCEWVWLLKKYELLFDVSEDFDPLCLSLVEWANEFGWDSDFGGIYDELDSHNNVVKDTKRIWPFTESIKANALLLDAQGADKELLKSRITEMVEVFRLHYISERGFWTESLNRDLTPASDYMPGTTPYHVYFGIMETKEAMDLRGNMKSISALLEMSLYTMRRNISNKIKNVKHIITQTGT